jgi:hypothetical protein
MNANNDMEVSTMPRRKKTETAPVAEVTAAVAAETVTEATTEAPAVKPVKKPAAKKAAAAKKPAAKTAKAAPKETVKIQFGVDEYDFAEIKKAVEADYKSKVKGRIKTVEIYIKPEDKAVYYVVNGDFSDKIDL